jgi:hypothetical protein
MPVIPARQFGEQLVRILERGVLFFERMQGFGRDQGRGSVGVFRSGRRYVIEGMR